MTKFDGDPTIDDADFERVGEKVVNAIWGEDFRVVLAVLRRAIVFTMAQVCPVARREIARNFKKDIPNLLAESNFEADRLAAPVEVETSHGETLH